MRDARLYTRLSLHFVMVFRRQPEQLVEIHRFRTPAARRSRSDGEHTWRQKANTEWNYYLEGRKRRPRIYRME